MIADTSEAAVWSLSDALLERDRPRALAIAERLLAQGENVTGLVYALASRLRKAQAALSQLEARRTREAGRGRSWGCIPTPPGSWSPGFARQLARASCGRRPRRSPTSRSGAAEAPTTATTLALTLALRRAAGAAARRRARRGVSEPASDSGRARLLAGAVAGVQGALLDRLVDPRDE